ncbi:MAG: sporulation protein YabP [Clostridia bacterium]|nr:sporulation protein YabP [Clostridia bacterium]
MPGTNANKDPGQRTAPRAGDITVTGREKIKLTGITGVVSFDEGNVTLTTTDGALTVDGSGLNITALDLERGEAAIDGRFIGMYFTEPRKKSGRRFFGRE